MAQMVMLFKRMFAEWNDILEEEVTADDMYEAVALLRSYPGCGNAGDHTQWLAKVELFLAGRN